MPVGQDLIQRSSDQKDDDQEDVDRRDADGAENPVESVFGEQE